jgi:hypothetical protein
VASLNGSSWHPVGGALNVDPGRNAFAPSIADVGGVPYVAWEEADASGLRQVHVASFNGTSWKPVGGALYFDATRDHVHPSIASVGGVPYVVWEEDSLGAKSSVHAAFFNGTIWQLVGSGTLQFTAGDYAQEPSIANVGGVAYVAWTEVSATSSQVHVAFFNGTDWQLAGSGTVPADPGTASVDPSIASVGGVPYVAWRDNAPNDRVHAAFFNATDWQLVGSGTVNIDTSHGVGVPSITGIGAVPYVAWDEFNGTHRLLHVAHFDGTSWQPVADALNNDQASDAAAPSITSIGGVPYVAWLEFSPHAQVRAARLEPDFVAESVTPSVRGATLTAQVNDYGVPLPVGFEYGRSAAFGSQTPLQSSPGTGVSTITAQLGGLTPGTKYFFRGFGSDTFRETSTGPALGFTTLALGGGGSGAAGKPVIPSATSRDEISNLQITPTAFVAAAHGRSAIAASARKPGAIVSYSGTQAALTTFTVQRAVAGRLQGHSCVKPTAQNRTHGSCIRYVTVGSFTREDLPGTIRFRFTGRLHGHKLAPGSYRLQAIPRNSAGAGSGLRRRFRIKR